MADVGAGAPSFVDEPPGNGMAENPEALRSTRAYVRNVALWLAGLPPSGLFFQAEGVDLGVVGDQEHLAHRHHRLAEMHPVGDGVCLLS